MPATSVPLLQNGFYVGNNFNAIFYGMQLVVYYLTVRVMLSRKHKHVPSDKFFLLFSTVILCLNTVFVATQAVFGEEMWIVNADYPGGMDAYLGDFVSVWYQTFGTAASIVLNVLSDGLLLYRCWIVWDDVRIIVFPSIVYLASFSLGIAQLVESGKPDKSYFAGLAKKLGIGYTSTIIGLEIIVTSLICARIIYVGGKYQKAVGNNVGRTYTSAAAMMVESAALTSLTGIAYLVTFAMGHDLEIFFLSIYVMMTCFAPQLIVLRVMSGRAWTRDKSTMFASNLEFTDRSTTRIGGTHDDDDEKFGKSSQIMASNGSNVSSLRVAEEV